MLSGRICLIRKPDVKCGDFGSAADARPRQEDLNGSMDDSNDLFSGLPLEKREEAQKPAAAAERAPAAAPPVTPRPAPAASNADEYGASSIRVLEGLEPVRMRPGMYIGGTDEKALHHLFAEVIDNAMDEAVAGHANFIEVYLDLEG
ncbi:DNA topoisomerase IV subunit B, partial [Bradyrhizobium sp. Lot11]